MNKSDDTKMKATLGSVIKKSRQGQNLTQDQLAEKVNVGARHIMSIENDIRRPSYELLKNLVTVLNIPASRVFFPSIDDDMDWCRTEIYQLLSQCTLDQMQVVLATTKAVLNQEGVQK